MRDRSSPRSKNRIDLFMNWKGRTRAKQRRAPSTESLPRVWDLRRALHEPADAFSYGEEPRAAKLRDAVETLDFTDPGDAWDFFEDTDPLVIAIAVNVLPRRSRRSTSSLPASGGIGLERAGLGPEGRTAAKLKMYDARE
jgi:hypothetical protein